MTFMTYTEIRTVYSYSQYVFHDPMELQPLLELSGSDSEGRDSCSTLPGVETLSPDDPDPADCPPDVWRRKQSKRAREESSKSFKERLSSELHLRALLGKKCTNCKHQCCMKFCDNHRFNQFLAFREEWCELHKLDQDPVVP